jgi:integrase
MSDPKHQTKRALSSLGWWFVAGVFIAAATIDALGIFGIAEGPHALVRWLFGLALRAGFDFPVHAHMLRHGCGYALANAGHDTRAIQDWLGHRSIQHTVRYTELSPTRFRDFWR